MKYGWTLLPQPCTTIFLLLLQSVKRWGCSKSLFSCVHCFTLFQPMFYFNTHSLKTVIFAKLSVLGEDRVENNHHSMYHYKKCARQGRRKLYYGGGGWVKIPATMARAYNFLYLSTRSSGHHQSFLISDFPAEILKAS